MSCTRRLDWVRATLLAGLVAAITWFSSPAGAQEADPVAPDGKGIVGGALLGAEVVMIVEAIIGVEEVWPYPVFGAVGAGAGAVGGWGVEQTGSAEAALYMLAGGMALVVPTLVAVLNATAYDPESESFDEGVQPEAEGEEGEGEEPAAPSVDANVDVDTGSRHRVPPALVGIDGRGVALGVPAVEIRPVYSPEELAKYGVEQDTELRFPIVRGAF